MTHFADNIKYLRKINRMTQEDLAKVLHKSRKTISAWESGTRSPIVADLKQISEYFKIDIVDLFDTDMALANITGSISVSEKELLDLFRSLPADQQAAVLNIMRSMYKE